MYASIALKGIIILISGLFGSHIVRIQLYLAYRAGVRPVEISGDVDQIGV